MKRVLLWMAVLAASNAHAAWMMGNVSITDLGTLGGASAEAWDINESGVIVGGAENSLQRSNAFRYQSGVMTSLMPGFAQWESTAYGINDSGVVTGILSDPSIPDFADAAFRWINGVPSFPNPGITHDGRPFSAYGFRINASGVIVGNRWCGQHCASQAVIWRPGQSYSLPMTQVFPNADVDFSTAWDINSNSDFVGSNDLLGESYLLKWMNSTHYMKIEPPDPPQAGATVLVARLFGLNDRRQVVGDASVWVNQNDTWLEAWYWNGTSAMSERLGVLPGGKNSQAWDLNEGVFIVGWSEANDQLPPPLFSPTYVRAFLYHKDFGMKPLPTLPTMPVTSSCKARSLNERKSSGVLEIVGKCESGGVKRAVRWTVNILSVR